MAQDLLNSNMFDRSMIDPAQIKWFKENHPNLLPSELQDKNYLGPVDDTESRETEGQAEISSKDQRKSVRAIDDEEWLKALRNVYYMPTPGVKKQRKDTDYLRGALGMLGDQYQKSAKSGGDLDLTMLGSLADWWAGGEPITKNYVNPGAVKKNEMLKLADLVQRAELGLSQSEAKLMQAQLVDALSSTRGLGGQISRTTGVNSDSGGMDAGEAARLAIAGEGLRLRKKNAENAQDAKTDKAVTDIVKELRPLTEMVNYMDQVDGIMKKYQGKDIPGLGAVDNRVPSFGNAIARKFSSDPEYYKDAEEMKAAIKSLTALRVRDLSGLAQTDKEFMRTLQQIGQDFGQDEHVTRTALRKLQSAARKYLEQRIDALPEAARKKYLEGENYTQPGQMMYRFNGSDISPPPPPPTPGKVKEKTVDAYDDAINALD